MIIGGVMGNSKHLKVLVTAFGLLFSCFVSPFVHAQTTIVIKADDQLR
jgi:hypothetical protein